MNDRDCENCIHRKKNGCESWDCNFEKRMTRKEAIEVLKDLWRYEHSEFSEKDIRKALDIAINSLEIDERYELEYEQTEPCEDAISRQALINKAISWNKHFIDSERYVSLTDIRNAPSVTPQPQPKTGRWIIKQGKEQGYDIAGIKTWYIQILCSECGFIKTAIEGHVGQYHYCPNCGAKME